MGVYLVPAQLPLPLLPLRGSAPLTGASACLAPVCWSTPGVGLVGFLCCATWFSPMCAAFPAAGSLSVFWSPGVCPSASLVTWVGLQPFPSFSGLLLLRLLAGVVGVCTLCQGAPVAVMSAWFAGEVTLLPFPHLRVGVFLAYGVSGVCGLRRRSRLPSWFVILFLCLLVLHLFWGWGGLVTGLCPLL